MVTRVKFNRDAGVEVEWVPGRWAPSRKWVPGYDKAVYRDGPPSLIFEGEDVGRLLHVLYTQEDGGHFYHRMEKTLGVDETFALVRRYREGRKSVF